MKLFDFLARPARAINAWPERYRRAACWLAAVMVLAGVLMFWLSNPFPGVGLYLVALLCLFGLVRRARRLPAVILAGLLCLPAGPPSRAEDLQPSGAGGAVCLVVIVVGGIAVYQIVKFCKRNFDPPPRPDTNALLHATTQTAQYASCIPVSSCAPEAGTGAAAAGFRLTGIIHDSATGPLLHITSHAVLTEANTITADEYTAALAAHGLRPSSPFERAFARAGEPAPASEVPISYADGVTTVPLGTGPLHQVVIEASDDLRSWQPLLTNALRSQVPMQFSVNDGETRQFYRLRLP
jgi:hypothetical protein